ncbi:hypothetical protein LTR37_015749 [Vermiconidia calcicola]|uniref:Uncharacterized protein n=1 Tax=Vermiconidia calcicola TaxID=1690605 RepID=A0ACC3MQ47_9PEZI|nr:hypothetical protein LTR37_015749 [Vermiconidia calcicola]
MGNIPKAYDFTAPQSLMRRLLVAVVVLSLKESDIEPSGLEDFHFSNLSAFTSDLAAQFLADSRCDESEAFLVDESVTGNK